LGNLAQELLVKILAEHLEDLLTLSEISEKKTHRLTSRGTPGKFAEERLAELPEEITIIWSNS